MLALLEHKEFDLNNYKTTFVISTKDKKIIQIPLLKSYSVAVTNLTYRLE